MLIEFAVENFRSFKEETVFSLIATKDESHPSHVVRTEGGKPLRVLRAAALYGANASGKSNLVNAIAFARDFIVTGTRASGAIPYEPFKLSAATRTAPSKFEFVFTIDDILYTYGFKADAARVHEEWLFATPGKKEVPYFERITDESGKVTVEFGATFRKQAERKKGFLEFVAEGTRPNQLFLTEAVERNTPTVQGIIHWLQQMLLFIPAEAKYEHLSVLTHANPLFTEFLSQLLILAGTGVTGIKTIFEPLNPETHFFNWPEDFKNDVLEKISEVQAMGNRTNVLSGAADGKSFGIFLDENLEPFFVEMRAQHLSAEQELIPFELNEESDGTQRLIHLAPTLNSILHNEQVLLLDEIDRRMHPLLSRLLVQTFLSGKSKGQLIFTTHETNLLDLELLRRDEVWFVEKNQSGTSQLYSLADFKIREDLKISKGYLNGRFGAIPFIGDISRLGWTEADQSTSTEKNNAAHLATEATA